MKRVKSGKDAKVLQSKGCKPAHPRSRKRCETLETLGYELRSVLYEYTQNTHSSTQQNTHTHTILLTRHVYTHTYTHA